MSSELLRGKLERVLANLSANSNSATVYHALVAIRTKWIKSKSALQILISQLGLVEKLIPLLQRPNTKVLDITLSILGNLMLEDLPRRQVLFVWLKSKKYNIWLPCLLFADSHIVNN